MDTRHVILTNPYAHLSESALKRFIAEQKRVMQALCPPSTPAFS